MAAETALGIPLILEKVLQYLEKEDLLQCRLVGPKCLWNKEACKLLQHKQVEFGDTQMLTTFNDTFQLSIQSISLTPSRFWFNMQCIVGEDENDMELLAKEMERFVQIAGNLVKDLVIWVAINESDKGLMNLLQVLIYQCFPNLNKVELNVRFVRADEWPTAAVQLKSRLDTFESNFISNLEELKIQVYSDSSFERSSINTLFNNFIAFTTELSNNAVQLKSIFLRFEILDSISSMEKSIVELVVPTLPPNLKQITLYPECLSRECVCSLAQHSTLALNDIRMYSIDTSNVTKSDLKHLLKRYQSTLEVLELDFTEPSQMRLPPEITMNKLRWLSVENFEGIIEWHRLPAIEDVELSCRSLEEIIPHVLSYPVNLFAKECLNIQWNSKPQTVFIEELAQDEPCQLPDPSIVTILKASRKLVSFRITKSNIREQDDSAKISAKYLPSLATHPVHFPILKFGITFDTYFVTPSDFQRFLNRYHETLRVMDLKFGVASENFCFPLGIHVNKLEDLTLKNFQGSLECNKLPVLKHVKLDSQSLHAIIPSIVASPDDCKIDSLECYNGTERDHHQDDLFISMFTQLASCLLPKLTALKIDQNCTAPLPVIFGSCKNLKHLELIRCRGVTDELLCGTGSIRPPAIPSQDENNNDEDSDNDSLLYTQYRAMVKEMRIRPYIGDLEELNYLKMDANDEDADAFSDISVLCGIVDCKKLDTIYLQSPNFSYERSQRILQANLQRFNEVWVHAGEIDD